MLSLSPEPEICPELKALSKKELEQKVKELEKLLKHEKMKSYVLDTLIDVAEENLIISIRKKFDTKQSEK